VRVQLLIMRRRRWDPRVRGGREWGRRERSKGMSVYWLRRLLPAGNLLGQTEDAGLLAGGLVGLLLVVLAALLGLNLLLVEGTPRVPARGQAD
jgi:hypothetical protein